MKLKFLYFKVVLMLTILNIINYHKLRVKTILQKQKLIK